MDLKEGLELRTSGVAIEPPPRSDATVARWTAPMARRIRRMIWGISSGFLGCMLLAGVLIIVRGMPSDDGTDQSFAMAVLMFVFMGVLPSLAIRHLLRRDIKVAPDLARHGIARTARVARHTRLPYGGMHKLDLCWQEDGRDAAAHFDIEKFDSAIPDEVVVLSRPAEGTVAAILGDEGFFLGKRT